MASSFLRAICRKIWRRKSTLEVEPAPFLAGLSCTFLWFRYAYLIGDSTMAPVNAIGVLIFSCYILFYFFMSKHRGIIARKILLTIAITTAIVVICSSSQNDIFYSGLFACASSLVFCASPLASIHTVLKTKSTDSLPFPMILCTFIVSSLWLMYGYLIENNFLIIPNALGSLISGSQLCLFAVYRKGTKVSYRVCFPLFKCNQVN